MQVVMGICIEQLCISQMSRSEKSVRYLDTKDQAEKGCIWLHIQDTMNLKLFGYLKVNLKMIWRS